MMVFIFCHTQIILGTFGKKVKIVYVHNRIWEHYNGFDKVINAEESLRVFRARQYTAEAVSDVPSCRMNKGKVRECCLPLDHRI